MVTQRVKPPAPKCATAHAYVYVFIAMDIPRAPFVAFFFT